VTPRCTSKWLDLFRPHSLLFSYGNSSFSLSTERAARKRDANSGTRGRRYNPIGGNRRKIRRLGIEMVGFIEAAERDILARIRTALRVRNETGIQSFLPATARRITARGK